jgi:hypothetical protein
MHIGSLISANKMGASETKEGVIEQVSGASGEIILYL